jgi:hypothetical protein
MEQVMTEKTNLTDHAKVRAQQRGIPPLIVDWLKRFGAASNDGHGAQVRYFDKRSRKLLEQRVGREVVSRLSELLDAYLVVGDDGTVVTVGHRYKRIHRH